MLRKVVQIKPNQISNVKFKSNSNQTPFEAFPSLDLAKSGCVPTCRSYQLLCVGCFKKPSKSSASRGEIPKKDFLLDFHSKNTAAQQQAAPGFKHRTDRLPLCVQPFSQENKLKCQNDLSPKLRKSLKVKSSYIF